MQAHRGCRASPFTLREATDRSVRFLGLWPIDGWRLKAGGIVYEGHRPRSELVAAARTTITDFPTLDGPGHGIGWVTIRDGRDGVFVVLDW